MFYSKVRQEYYIVDENHKCKACDKSIGGFCFVFAFPKQILLFCKNCYTETEKYNREIITSRCLALITDNIPNDSIPILKFLPDISYSSKSNTEIAIDRKIGGKIIDKTRLAARESIEGATIGIEPTERLAELDKPINRLEDGLSYLKQLKDYVITTPQIESQETKLIENN